MRTGKGRSEGQAFHRRLLSEYNTEITLENYVAYFELKPIAKSVEQLRKEIDEHTSLAAAVAAAAMLSSTSHEGTFGPMATTESDPALEEMMKKRHELEEKFFVELRASFVKVKKYLWQLEDDLLTRVHELEQLTEEEIRAMPDECIAKLYVKVQTILRYRSLNLAAFRKIMKKFMERCACDSLELQQRLMSIDETIFNSAIAQPRLDLRRIALDLIALYGTVYRLTYEETVAHLSHYEYRAGVNIRRILPHSDTFFFTLNFPHQERQGNFAARILSGSTSLFCEKMICEVLQCPRYPPCCNQFPNGEINVSLSRTLRGDDVFVLQSLVRCDHLGLSHSGTFMELALMLHTARLSSAARITAVIPYLAYADSVSSVAVVAELLEKMGCQHVITVDMSSEQVEGMFSVPLENISARYEFVRFIAKHLTNEGHDFRNITVVSPSGTSVSRAKYFADALMNYMKLSSAEQFVSVCTAVHRHPNLPPPPPVKSVSHRPCATDKPTATVTTTAASSATCQTSVPEENSSKQQEAQKSYSHSRAGTVLDLFSPPPRRVSPTQENASNTVAFVKALRQQEEGVSAICEDRADNPAQTDGVALVGDVKGRLCIIVDTTIDEAIKICRTAWKLHEAGASRIILIATHLILSAGAEERLVKSPIDLIVVTDSVNQDVVFKKPLFAQKLRLLPIAPLLARAIEKMHTENTLATLFEK
ncbi:putative ribose-phosphate pyrophosphokinase [Trypanosoma cruzi]|uniref:Ribose-phosphate pyrophosphokinase, putative n=2 Tax=Trypanosoma cruzi TaxID=5693 RepID=Q4DIR4_TRYCC|nr:ribose-phosphate pyrophosphokinase, putative [Trypanosoma cruzi]EAN92422.1 ribose-phosphate pyrophosphokinase, putative [Trypanosoma cruzi]PWV00470.1 putative ribose-phosphate pyrophosphokinase [Trypanosoma cruzi]|eukprot:XP_814273.1 ribose-phosphate pyrophosphokinase [Trypanosoma cruzi strain CL Brener]